MPVAWARSIMAWPRAVMSPASTSRATRSRFRLLHPLFGFRGENRWYRLVASRVSALLSIHP